MKITYPLTVVLLCFLSSCSQITNRATPDSSNKNFDYYQTYIHATSLLKKKSDSAFFYFNEVANNSKDSMQIAAAFIQMSIIQNDAGDYFGSQESLIESLKVLKQENKRNHPYLFSAYNELGNTNLKLKNYDTALNYYNKALEVAKNDSLQVIVFSHKAVVYQKKKNYTQALAIYKLIIEKSKSSNRRYARILSNMARLKWEQNPNYYASPELLKALYIRTVENDRWGLNASYAHLSDYYSNSKPDSGLFYARKMYHIAQELDSPDDQLEALKKLMLLSPETQIKRYYLNYQSLNDSLQTVRNNNKNQFALIRYNIEKHKETNLFLQKDNAEARLRVIWLQLSSIILFIAAISGFIWYRRRKRQAVREQQLRLSKKVHDKVANGIYRIMSEVEHRGIISLEWLLDKLEMVYNLSRDISYDGPDMEEKDYHLTVSELLDSFNGDKIKVSVAGNNAAIWTNVTPYIRQEISVVLQELMTNMKKHSKAGNVDIVFAMEGQNLLINYSDDGIGLSPAFRPGNGLTNTENRIAALKGLLIFDQVEKNGLQIKIFIPIA